jgi:hypothetical protein
VDDISSRDVDPKETARVDAAAAAELKGLCHEMNNFVSGLLCIFVQALVVFLQYLGFYF